MVKFDLDKTQEVVPRWGETIDFHCGLSLVRTVEKPHADDSTGYEINGECGRATSIALNAIRDLKRARASQAVERTEHEWWKRRAAGYRDDLLTFSTTPRLMSKLGEDKNREETYQKALMKAAPPIFEGCRFEEHSVHTLSGEEAEPLFNLAKGLSLQDSVVFIDGKEIGRAELISIKSGPVSASVEFGIKPDQEPSFVPDGPPGWELDDEPQDLLNGDPGPMGSSGEDLEPGVFPNPPTRPNGQGGEA